MSYWHNGHLFPDPEPPVNPPDEERGVATCRECDGEIYAHEYYGEDGKGNCYCMDCINSMWEDMSDEEKLEALGFIVIQPTE